MLETFKDFDNIDAKATTAGILKNRLKFRMRLSENFWEICSQQWTISTFHLILDARAAPRTVPSGSVRGPGRLRPKRAVGPGRVRGRFSRQRFPSSPTGRETIPNLGSRSLIFFCQILKNSLSFGNYLRFPAILIKFCEDIGKQFFTSRTVVDT